MLLLSCKSWWGKKFTENPHCCVNHMVQNGVNDRQQPQSPIHKEQKSWSRADYFLSKRFIRDFRWVEIVFLFRLISNRRQISVSDRDRPIWPYYNICHRKLYLMSPQEGKETASCSFWVCKMIFLSNASETSATALKAKEPAIVGGQAEIKSYKMDYSAPPSKVLQMSTPQNVPPKSGDTPGWGLEKRHKGRERPRRLLGHCSSENRSSAAGQEETGQYRSVLCVSLSLSGREYCRMCVWITAGGDLLISAIVWKTDAPSVASNCSWIAVKWTAITLGWRRLEGGESRPRLGKTVENSDVFPSNTEPQAFMRWTLRHLVWGN